MNVKDVDYSIDYKNNTKQIAEPVQDKNADKAVVNDNNKTETAEVNA